MKLSPISVDHISVYAGLRKVEKHRVLFRLKVASFIAVRLQMFQPDI